MVPNITIRFKGILNIGGSRSYLFRTQIHNLCPMYIAKQHQFNAWNTITPNKSTNKSNVCNFFLLKGKSNICNRCRGFTIDPKA